MCNKTDKVSAAYSFLNANLTALDEQTKNAAKENGLEMVTADYYIRRLLDNNAELIRNSDDEKIGTSPFQGDKLPEGEAFVLQGMSIGWANHATETAVSDRAYSTTVATFESIYHGNVEIYQNNKLLLKVPVKSIADFAQNDSSKVYDLRGVMKLLVPKKSISVKLLTAEGVALPANNNFLEIGFHGISTKYRS